MTTEKTLIFAVFLLITSLWLTVSVLFTLISGGNSSTAGFGGYFLYHTFYHAAFYVPAYLVLCAFFLLRKKFNKNDIVVLILTLIPFFTAGITLRIFLGAGNTSFEKIIYDSFGPLSPLLLLITVIIELILIMHVSLFLKKHSEILENREEVSENTDNNKSDIQTEDLDAGKKLFSSPSDGDEFISSEEEKASDGPGNSVISESVKSASVYMSESSYSPSGESALIPGLSDAFPDTLLQIPSNEEDSSAETDQATEKFKPLSLSSVSFLKGRKGPDTEENYHNTENAAYSNYKEEDISHEKSGADRYNPADFGMDLNQVYHDRQNKRVSSNGKETSLQTGSEEAERVFDADDEISTESSFGGVDYSEPAYFRQPHYSPLSEAGKNKVFRETENTNLHNVNDYSGYDEYESDNNIPVMSDEESSNEYNTNETDEDLLNPLRDNEKGQFTDHSDDSDEMRVNNDYDPVTQYNPRISTAESELDDNFQNESFTLNPSETDEEDSILKDKEKELSELYSPELYPEADNPGDENEDDFEDDDPGQLDNTAIVKQYFETARFIKPSKKPGKYEIAVEDVLDFYQEESYDRIDARAQEEAEVLKRTLAEFKIEAEVTGIRKGPVITMFEILPAPGVKLSRITNLADNIALRLAASRVRIVAPIPGKHAVGIEVPNRKRAIVSFRELIEVDYSQYKKDNLPVVLGKDITGGEQIVDLTKTPHLLIAGATGSGKSVCVNSIITSILYKRPPRDVKMILIDPKIVELKLYNGIPHLLTPVITDAKKAYQALQYCVFEMERRYTLLDALSCRDIKSFNKKIKSEKIATMPLPYIVVVVDEFADLMATTGKELESTLARLAAMSRAVGIHLVLATQRPSIDVITGLIKANIPSRIAFMVASKTDSRIIIDSMGAEMLLGKGDMLFTSAWNPYPVRIQGAFLSENEVERVVEKVKEYGDPEYIDDEIFIDDDEDDYTSFEEENINDPLMNKALEIVTTAGKASASYLQRRLKIGYNRAARLVEEMERKGIVGPQNGSKPRDLLHIPDNFRE